MASLHHRDRPVLRGRRQPGDLFSQSGWHHPHPPRDHHEEPQGWSLAGRLALLAIVAAVLTVGLLWLAGQRAQTPAGSPGGGAHLAGWTWDERAAS